MAPLLKVVLAVYLTTAVAYYQAHREPYDTNYCHDCHKSRAIKRYHINLIVALDSALRGALVAFIVGLVLSAVAASLPHA